MAPEALRIRVNGRARITVAMERAVHRSPTPMVTGDFSVRGESEDYADD